MGLARTRAYQRIEALGAPDYWAELRSATEQCVVSPARIDRVVFALATWPEEAGPVERARVYARQKLERLALGRCTAWEIASWCLEGLEALRAHLGRFRAPSDRGVERWLSMFAWTVAVSQRHGLEVGDTQATASYEVADGAGHRQLILMIDHDGLSYVLDVHHSAQYLCMGIVSRRERGIKETLVGQGLAAQRK